MFIGFSCSGAIRRSCIIQGHSCHLMGGGNQICLALAPHLMVPCTASVRNSLVVYSGMVGLLILFVFCVGSSALLFLCTLVWKDVIFVLYSPYQMLVQCIFFLPIIPLSHIVLWVHL